VAAPCAVLLLSSACEQGEGEPITVTFDPCRPLLVGTDNASAEQQASLDDSIAMWQARDLPELRHAHPGEVADVTLRFQRAAGNFHGFYDGARATIYINAALDDRHARAVTIAHELGHAYGLLHVDLDERHSVMNRANVMTEPTAEDGAAITALWGECHRAAGVPRKR
jgi:uncharacterized protein YjaZ